MTTTPENAQSWRDLQDQLTAEQIAELEFREAEQWPPGLASPEDRLNTAQMMVQHNQIQAKHAHIASPAAATRLREWQEWNSGHARMFTASERNLAALGVVEVGGVQHQDGRAEYSINAFVTDEQIDAAQARTVAAALLDAADELDDLTNTDKAVKR